MLKNVFTFSVNSKDSVTRGNDFCFHLDTQCSGSSCIHWTLELRSDELTTGTSELHFPPNVPELLTMLVFIQCTFPSSTP